MRECAFMLACPLCMSGRDSWVPIAIFAIFAIFAVLAIRILSFCTLECIMFGHWFHGLVSGFTGENPQTHGVEGVLV
jgi:hypothetical protein